MDASDWYRKAADVCEYSGCDRPVTRKGSQGGYKRFCSGSCRTMANRERRKREAEDPLASLRAAAFRAHAELSSESVRDALRHGSVEEPVAKNLRKCRDVLGQILDRLPPDSE